MGASRSWLVLGTGVLLRGLASLLLGVLVLTGCASLPERQVRPETQALVAAANTPLGAVARDAGLAPSQSGLWPMPEATVALDARFELMQRATVSLDVQYYHVADDGVGRSVLRALRDAARRGVRVRLLLDDLYTSGMDDLLRGLAAEPHVEVRLFNPFPARRASAALRALDFLRDFKRLNQRMHNKLMVADGSVAVVGGRNLADEYFFRHAEANFIDFDLLVCGAVLPQLNGWFDRYWNSAMAYPVESLLHGSAAPGERIARFDRMTAADARPTLPAEVDMFGDPPFGRQLQSRRFAFTPGSANAWADEPAKAQDSRSGEMTVKQRFVREMGAARERLVLFSPYFIPGRDGVESLKRLRQRGVDVRVVTNSLVASDEPLVNVGYAQYRVELLKAGVRLFEVASERLKSDSRISRLLGGSAGRLHAKMAFIDGETLLVGSMNLDPRSEHTNNEIGLVVHSPATTRRVQQVFDTDRNVDFEVKLGDDGDRLVWVSRTGDIEQRSVDEPDPGWWQRLKLRLMWLLVPEDLL
jgi:phosphatidylserine/phosphatidylglycerophosphate/cardiolipin synthase-like enzyme